MFGFKKKTCFICGKKVGFSALNLAGNKKICSSCEALLRGNYNLVRRGTAFYDALSELDPFYAKHLIEKMKETQKEDITRFEGLCSGIITVISKSFVPKHGLEKGGEDIVRFCGKPVFICFCEKGSFEEGDEIRIIGRNFEKEAAILKLIPCTGAYPFEEELISKAHKTQFSQNSNAWIITDICCDDVENGDKFIKY